MKQTFVATPTPLLENGKLKTAGYSTHMNFIYDGKTVKSRRLKEWDFYQILFGDYVLQFTMGHVSYAAPGFRDAVQHKKRFSCYRLSHKTRQRQTAQKNAQFAGKTQCFAVV